MAILRLSQCRNLQTKNATTEVEEESGVGVVLLSPLQYFGCLLYSCHKSTQCTSDASNYQHLLSRNGGFSVKLVSHFTCFLPKFILSFVDMWHSLLDALLVIQRTVWKCLRKLEALTENRKKCPIPTASSFLDSLIDSRGLGERTYAGFPVLVQQ